MDQAPGIHNFFVGNDPRRWQSRVPGFRGVARRGLYPGIDLEARIDGAGIRYDLQLEAGADPSKVIVRCAGTTALDVEADGHLLMKTVRGDVRQSPPVAWHELLHGEPTATLLAVSLPEPPRKVE